MKKPVLLLVILLFPALVYIFFSTGKHRMMHLSIFYPEDVKTTVVDGKEKTDTIYHTIPPFRFINQDGDTVTDKNFADKIYVADFFFTTCPTICPKMMFQMERVNAVTQKTPDFLIISHTVNPAHDSVPVLAEYSKLVHADSKKWMLVTGNKKDIYDIAIDGYKLAVEEDPRAPGGFLHSEMFVLVDKDKRIRGYYDGTDSAHVNKLINDIKIVSAEYQSRNSKPKIYQKHE
ncbi:MAG: SCO family protein [Bacteroidetes bacterium]|nr:SCO family protein [Bacteroidota bacterium]